MPRSPILLFENNISSGPLLIAPEREKDLSELRERLGGIPFDIVDEILFGLRAIPEERRIVLPIASLEYVWVCAFKQWVVYDEMRLAQFRGDSTIDLQGNLRLRGAADLYRWSRQNLLEHGNQIWPTNLPRPEAPPSCNSDIAVANELALGAIAFMLLHELGHLDLGHSIVGGALSQQQEKEADRFATEWIFGVGGLDEPSLRKRGLCVASALLCLQSLETRTIFRINRDHPPVHERIDTCMGVPNLIQNDALAAFTVAGLQDLFAGTIQVDQDGKTFPDIRDDFLLKIARRSSD